MELDNRKYAQYTEYPEIFLSAYWGNNRLIRIGTNIIDSDSLEIICENRNRFVTEYLIKKYYYLPRLKGLKRILQTAMIFKDVPNHSDIRCCSNDIRDHIEYYKCSDGRILTIFSMEISNEELHNFILSKGYTLIQPLYWTNQRTYLKFI
jgi:hypothetical protein